MSWHLIRTDESGEVTDKSYKVSVRGQSVEEGNSLLAIVSSLCLYLAFIFLSTAGTILAVQALSDASRHKYRYTVLSRLGVSDSRLCKTVGKQLLILFDCPCVPSDLTFLCMTSVNRLYSMLLESSRYICCISSQGSASSFWCIWSILLLLTLVLTKYTGSMI